MDQFIICRGRKLNVLYFFHFNLGKGVIDFVEFLEMWAKFTGDLDETIKEAFNLFDKDGSGAISMEEFRRVMVNEGAQMTDEEIDEIIAEADVDGDGQLNIDGMTTVLRFNEYFRVLI